MQFEYPVLNLWFWGRGGECWDTGSAYGIYLHTNMENIRHTAKHSKWLHANMQVAERQ